MKKKIALALAAVLSMSVFFAGCGGGTPAPSSSQPAASKSAEPEGSASKEPEGSTAANDGETLKVAMCTDIGGIEDRSFNQSVWEGLKTAEETLGVKAEYLQSTTEADYPANLDTLMENGNKLIIGVGFALAEATAAAAEENPDTFYACIDNEYTELSDNLQGVIFKEEQGGFLAGYIAGLTTETNKIGFVGGMEFPSVKRYEFGYRYGAKLANPEVTVTVEYCNSFTDVAMGKSKAQKLYQEDGCDIVFAAAGSCGIGSIEAAKELNQKIIGVDMDQSYLAPENVIATPLKRCDLAVQELSKQVQNGSFEGGQNFVGDIANGMIGMSYTDLVAEDVKNATDEIMEKVKSGEVVVPNTEEALTAELDKM